MGIGAEELVELEVCTVELKVCTVELEVCTVELEVCTVELESTEVEELDEDEIPELELEAIVDDDDVEMKTELLLVVNMLEVDFVDDVVAGGYSWYILSRLGPPQNSNGAAAQVMLHPVDGTDPAFITFPQ